MAIVPVAFDPPQLRGTSQTRPCPQCGDAHQSVANLHGIPVLVCPSLAEGELRLRGAGTQRITFLVGPERPAAPVAGWEDTKLAPAESGKRRAS